MGAEGEVIVTSISFSEAAVEIQFLERRDQSEKAGLMKSMVLDRATFSRQIDEIEDNVVDLVDDGLLEIRNPEASLDPRKRIGARKAEPVDEEGDE